VAVEGGVRKQSKLRRKSGRREESYERKEVTSDRENELREQVQHRFRYISRERARESYRQGFPFGLAFVSGKPLTAEEKIFVWEAAKAG
jgi:hypothetical protein